MLSSCPVMGLAGSIPPPSAYGLMVKWTSYLVSTQAFRVRILVGLLIVKRKGYPIGDGSRLEAGRA